MGDLLFCAYVLGVLWVGVGIGADGVDLLACLLSLLIFWLVMVGYSRDCALAYAVDSCLFFESIETCFVLLLLSFSYIIVSRSLHLTEFI